MSVVIAHAKIVTFTNDGKRQAVCHLPEAGRAFVRFWQDHPFWDRSVFSTSSLSRKAPYLARSESVSATPSVSHIRSFLRFRNRMLAAGPANSLRCGVVHSTCPAQP
jgi:hypothetical protein